VPTRPSLSRSFWCWKQVTAWSVADPKSPSTVSPFPPHAPLTIHWIALTALDGTLSWCR
jgi:hypothetical protein